MGAPQRVLVADDEPAVRQAVVRCLHQAGYVTIEVGDGTAALAAVIAEPPDLVILDVGMPAIGGFDVLTKIRQSGDLPVILLTGRGDEIDRVVGLELGADDYVVKPFSGHELAARVRTVLRRAKATAFPGERRVYDGLTLDLATREVTAGGRPVELTAKEFDLLAFLMASPGRALSRGQILATVWAASAGWHDPATVTEHVRRIRRKIEPNPGLPRWIRTVRGVGYRFVP